jgi:hypothetical protein
MVGEGLASIESWARRRDDFMEFDRDRLRVGREDFGEGGDGGKLGWVKVALGVS